MCATYWKRFVALFCAKRGTCQIPSPDVTPHKILLRIVSTIFGKEWFTRPRWGCWLLTCMDPIKEPPCWFADPSHKLGLKLLGLVVTPRWLKETRSIKTLQWQLGGIRGCKRNWEALINFHAVGGGGVGALRVHLLYTVATICANATTQRFLTAASEYRKRHSRIFPDFPSKKNLSILLVLMLLLMSILTLMWGDVVWLLRRGCETPGMLIWEILRLEEMLCG